MGRKLDSNRTKIKDMTAEERRIYDTDARRRFRERNNISIIPKLDPNRIKVKDMNSKQLSDYRKKNYANRQSKISTITKEVNPKAMVKVGKIFDLGYYNHTKIQIEIINVNRFKSVQARIGTWIKVDLLTSQMDLDRCLLVFKKIIKKQIKELSQTYFNRESIISFSTAAIHKKINDKQFLDLDIVFFVNKESIYEKITIMKILEPFLKSVVDDVLHNDNNCFEISSIYGDKRTTGRRAKF